MKTHQKGLTITRPFFRRTSKSLSNILCPAISITMSTPFLFSVAPWKCNANVQKEFVVALESTRLVKILCQFTKDALSVCVHMCVFGMSVRVCQIGKACKLTRMSSL